MASWMGTLRTLCRRAAWSPLVLAAAVWATAAPAAAPSGAIPGAVIVFETPPGTPGSDPASAPPRFVLLKDGQVFVGGTGVLETGRIGKDEAQVLRRGAEAIRKAAGRERTLWVGGEQKHVALLRLPEDSPEQITITGDPSAAPPSLRPAAAFVDRLLRFDDPGLALYKPESYAVRAREQRLAGGCRTWSFSFPIAEALAGPRIVAAGEAGGWPTGAWPASVCAGGKRFVVTLRPLLPGEQP